MRKKISLGIILLVVSLLVVSILLVSCTAYKSGKPYYFTAKEAPSPTVIASASPEPSPSASPEPSPPPPCTDECPSGSKTCDRWGQKSYTCGNYDSDSCLEWSSGTFCQYGCVSGECQCSPPDCNDGNDCTVDKCKDGICEHTNKPDGTDCDPPGTVTEGFCGDGICLEKTCKNVYGDDYEPCGSGPGLNCCFKDNCYKGEICCKPNEEGRSFLGRLYCSPTSCPSHLPVLCEADNQNVCCPAGSKCIEHSGWGFDKAECGKEECNTEDGEHECPPEDGDYFKGGVKCCKKDQECKPDPVYGYWLCQDKDCENGYTHCQGKKNKKDYTWRKRCCKDGVEVCSWQPNGYPICMPIS